MTPPITWWRTSRNRHVRSHASPVDSHGWWFAACGLTVDETLGEVDDNPKNRCWRCVVALARRAGRKVR